MSVLATVIIFILILFIYIQVNKNQFITEFNKSLAEYCASLPVPTYRREVFVPFENGVYQKDLAIALTDISFNVSQANCSNILPLPNPPGFNQQLRVEGIDPFNKQPLMYAYIFWNKGMGWACIAFTGTVLLTEWQSDLEYEQVAPTILNGYEDGVLVHKGFYGIYTAVRNILWDWWNQNKSWMQSLFITGHSLGGGLSTICAYDFADVFKEATAYENANNSTTGPPHVFQIPVHYSIAAPRSGNVKYAQIFNRRVPTSLRINNTEDLIPAVPPGSWRGWTYEQTGGNIPFTVSLGSLVDDHVNAYYYHLPLCAEVAPCHVDEESE